MRIPFRQGQLSAWGVLVSLLVGRFVVAAAEESPPIFLAGAEQAWQQGEEASGQQHSAEAIRAYRRGLVILNEAGVPDNFTPTSKAAQLYVSLSVKYLNALVMMADGVWRMVYERPEKLPRTPDSRRLVTDAMAAYQTAIDFLETLEATYSRIRAAIDVTAEPPPNERSYSQALLGNSYFSLGSLAAMMKEDATTKRCIDQLRVAGRNEAADRLLRVGVQIEQDQHGTGL